MAIPSPKFLEIYARAIQCGTETTLHELLEALDMPDSTPTLDKLSHIRATLSACKLELVPGFAQGGLDTTRILRSAIAPNFETQTAIDAISAGESANQEFKASLIYDHKKAAYQPTPGADLKSDEVTHACLKTIAAFLTSHGGVLYVGVDNNGDPVGIEPDFNYLKGQQTQDGWELHLRNLISGRFKDGSSVNDYVKVYHVEMEGKAIARVSVQRRRLLSFLKRNDKYQLYRRQGNRTVEVNIEEMEEFMAMRRSEW